MVRHCLWWRTYDVPGSVVDVAVHPVHYPGPERLLWETGMGIPHTSPNHSHRAELEACTSDPAYPSTFYLPPHLTVSSTSAVSPHVEKRTHGSRVSVSAACFPSLQSDPAPCKSHVPLRAGCSFNTLSQMCSPGVSVLLWDQSHGFPGVTRHSTNTETNCSKECWCLLSASPAGTGSGLAVWLLFTVRNCGVCFSLLHRGDNRGSWRG